MPITERTLKRWRGDALGYLSNDINVDSPYTVSFQDYREVLNRILRMTSELLDIGLLKKRKLQ